MGKNHCPYQSQFIKGEKLIATTILTTILITLASSLSTITGFGTTTISLPILSLFFPIHETILFISITHWFENIWRIILFKKGFSVFLILQFGIPAIISTFIGAKVSIHMQEKLLSQILGSFLIIYSLFIILNPQYRLKKKWATSTIGGSLSGFFAGIIGLGGAIRAAFLSAFDLSKAEYIFSTNLISLLIDFTRIPVYMHNGTKLPKFFIWSIILFIPLSFIATHLMKKFIIKLPQKKFRIIIAILLALSGLKFLL